MSYARDNRGRGRNAERDSRGRYSSRGYSRNGDMMEKLHDMMDEASPDMKDEFRKFIDKMERM
jgi:hypothetical protein